MINSKYQGDIIVAISRYGEMYDIRVGINTEELNNSLDIEGKCLNRFEVLKLYPGVNLSVIPILNDAAKKLERGEIVDLSNILS